MCICGHSGTSAPPTDIGGYYILYTNSHIRLRTAHVEKPVKPLMFNTVNKFIVYSINLKPDESIASSYILIK